MTPDVRFWYDSDSNGWAWRADFGRGVVLSGPLDIPQGCSDIWTYGTVAVLAELAGLLEPGTPIMWQHPG